VPAVVIFSEPRGQYDVDPDASRPDLRRTRFKVRKPRLPWTYAPRSKERRLYTECGGPRIYHDRYSSPAGLAAAIKKACGPRKMVREFDPGGPEAGTLVDARRAAGLFDSNWDREFPLTRKEREALGAGALVPDPFFAPPTSPAPENWIDDKLKRIRGTFGPTRYTTPKGLLPFCPEGGFGITCAGPDQEVAWTGGTTPLTPLDVARFKEAYCAPGQCQTGGKLTPPAGYKELVIKMKPRNPAVRLKASCQPVLSPEPVIMDFPPPPAGPVPAPSPAAPVGITAGCPAGWYWAIGLTGVACSDPALHRQPATAEQLIAILGYNPGGPIVA